MDSIRTMNDFIIVIRHFFSRPDVLWQLLPLLVYPALWFILRFIWSYPDKALRRFLIRRLPKRSRGTIRRFLFILRRTFAPLVSVIALYAIRLFYTRTGRISGLLNEFIIVAWVLLIYRFVVAVLYAYLPDRTIKNYHRRLLTPLIYFICYRLAFTHHHATPRVSCFTHL